MDSAHGASDMGCPAALLSSFDRSIFCENISVS